MLFAISSIIILNQNLFDMQWIFIERKLFVIEMQKYGMIFSKKKNESSEKIKINL